MILPIMILPLSRLPRHLVCAALIALTTLHSPLPTLGATKPAEYARSISRLEPMDTTGLDTGIAHLLRNYYLGNFTSADTWVQTQSIRLDGTLHLPQGVIRFTAFKKKPDYCKVALFAGNGTRVVMAYDGTDAWQLSSGSAGVSRAAPDAQPAAMTEGDARNFILGATTGGHLLYPQIEGKEIQLLGVAPFDGNRHYELQTTLPDGQQIRHYLDMITFEEVRQVTINHLTGDEEVKTHSDFRTIDGIRIPFVSTLTIDGKQIHQSRIDSVQINSGIMPWMFSRPSGAFIPNAPGGSTSAPSPP